MFFPFIKHFFFTECGANDCQVNDFKTNDCKTIDCLTSETSPKISMHMIKDFPRCPT